MLKKLLLSSLLLYVPTVGTHVAFADTVVPDGGSSGKIVQPGVQTEVNQTTDTQEVPNNNNLNQPLPPTGSQTLPSDVKDGSTPSEKQGTDNQNSPKPDDQTETVHESNINQDQSTVTNIVQSQNTTGNPTVVQNQQADVTKCQNQAENNTVTCQDQNASDPTGDSKQSETTSIEAGQVQTASSPKKEKVEQNQDSTLASSQVQEVTLPSGESSSHSQSTGAATKQKQTAKAKEQSSILQWQFLGINNALNEKLKKVGPKKELQKQETKIKEVQTQQMKTSGSASMKQEQSVDVKSNMVDILKNISMKEIKETSINSIKIIKNSVNTVVKVVQKIMVNNKLVDVNAHNYTLEEIKANEPHQEYDKKYDWGTLKVINSAFVDFNDQLQSFEIKMKSFLYLDFFGKGSGGHKKHKTGSNGNPPPPNQGGVPVTPVPTGNGGTTKGTDSGNQGSTPVTSVPTGNGGTTKGADSGNKGSDLVTPVSVKSTKTTQVKPTVTSLTETKQVNNNQEQKLTVTTKDQNVQNAEVTKKVNSLPITATNSYNYLFFGSLLLVLGMLLFFIRRRV